MVSGEGAFSTERLDAFVNHSVTKRQASCVEEQHLGCDRSGLDPIARDRKEAKQRRILFEN